MSHTGGSVFPTSYAVAAPAPGDPPLQEVHGMVVWDVYMAHALCGCAMGADFKKAGNIEAIVKAAADIADFAMAERNVRIGQ